MDASSSSSPPGDTPPGEAMVDDEALGVGKSSFLESFSRVLMSPVLDKAISASNRGE
jgi:hypothetical protein